jgi:hypothetical protein
MKKAEAWTVWQDLGFSPEEADRLESTYLARRTDERLQRAKHILKRGENMDNLTKRLAEALRNAIHTGLIGGEACLYCDNDDGPHQDWCPIKKNQDVLAEYDTLIKNESHIAYCCRGDEQNRHTEECIYHTPGEPDSV